jgi:hypothetical protein
MKAVFVEASEKYAAIEAAFSKLPPGSSAPVKKLIPGAAARTLCRMRDDPRQRLPEEEEKRLRELPPIIPSGGLSQKDWDLLSRQPRPRPIRKRLDQFAESAGRTLELLDELKDILPHSLSRRLWTGLVLAREAARTSKDKIGVQKGQPKKTQKMKIAWTVGLHYFWITDNKPTVITASENKGAYNVGDAHGPFLDLLVTVYQALGIRGGAEAAARKVAAEWDHDRALKILNGDETAI